MSFKEYSDRKELVSYLKANPKTMAKIGNSYIAKQVFPLKAKLQQLRNEYAKTKDEVKRKAIQVQAEEIKKELKIYE